MLIVTLPDINRIKQIRDIVSHPLVSGVRYNVGMRTQYSAQETLSRILYYTKQYGKKLWIDVKGRQLRIEQWADPTYGDIVLNHSISVDVPARIIFRHGGESLVVAVSGKKIFVDPNPSEALGAGQAVNIVDDSLVIDGYLTERDKEYILAAKDLGIVSFMLSFAEQASDVAEVIALCPNADMVLKIESKKGVDLINQFSLESWPNCRLMAARDDLMIQLSRSGYGQVLKTVMDIKEKDPEAIVASHLFESLERGSLSAADVSDFVLLTSFGYKHFMFSDEVSQKHFPEAISLWRELNQEGALP